VITVLTRDLREGIYAVRFNSWAGVGSDLLPWGLAMWREKHGQQIVAVQRSQDSECRSQRFTPHSAQVSDEGVPHR
jgi:hypothetical protein